MTPNETIHIAWERFKSLLKRCPNHDLTPGLQVITFYRGCVSDAQRDLNVASGGALLHLGKVEAMEVINRVAANDDEWGDDGTKHSQVASVVENHRIDLLAKQVELLIKQVKLKTEPAPEKNNLENILETFMQKTQDLFIQSNNRMDKLETEVQGISTQLNQVAQAVEKIKQKLHHPGRSKECMATHLRSDSTYESPSLPETTCNPVIEPKAAVAEKVTITEPPRMGGNSTAERVRQNKAPEMKDQMRDSDKWWRTKTWNDLFPDKGAENSQKVEKEGKDFYERHMEMGNYVDSEPLEWIRMDYDTTLSVCSVDHIEPSRLGGSAPMEKKKKRAPNKKKKEPGKRGPCLWWKKRWNKLFLEAKARTAPGDIIRVKWDLW